MYERGMAYQAESLVNYDPVDRTVLANEQVLKSIDVKWGSVLNVLRSIIMVSPGDPGQKWRREH